MMTPPRHRPRFAFAVALALASLVPAAGHAQRAESAVAAQKTGDSYTYDIAIPPAFLAAISDPARAGYNAMTGPATIDGKTYEVTRTQFAWVDDASNTLANGRFAFARGEHVESNWFHSFDKNDAGLATFVAKMQRLATRNAQGWNFVTLSYLTPTDATPVRIAYLPSPSALPTALLAGEADKGLKLRQTIVRLSNQTQPGKWFPEVRVPVDLAGVRTAMLEYGNSQRMNAQFRAKAGSKRATDLDLSLRALPATVLNTEDKPEPVYPQPDMMLDPTLADAAQWFAEAMAAGKSQAHAFTPGGWTDPATGKAVWMKEPWDRTKYFGVPPARIVPEIAAPKAASGMLPYSWMVTDTHHRWYFGIDGTYPGINYGAAQGADGLWYYVGVSEQIKPAAK